MGRRLDKYGHQGPRRLPPRPHRAGRRPPAHDRGTGVLATIGSTGAVRRPVRHRLGHHEQLHRHLEGADDQPRRRRSRHRRSAAGHRHRPRRRHSGGHDLQRLRALDRRLQGARAATLRPNVLAPRLAATIDRATRARIRCARRRSSSPWPPPRPDGDDDLAETHEINVTPFIDVMLVLLIIFMVAAPLATVDVAGRPAVLDRRRRSRKPDKPLYLTLKVGPVAGVGNDPVLGEAGLGPALDRAHQQRPGTAHLPARRQDRRLRRADGGDERCGPPAISRSRWSALKARPHPAP